MLIAKMKIYIFYLPLKEIECNHSGGRDPHWTSGFLQIAPKLEIDTKIGCIQFL